MARKTSVKLIDWWNESLNCCAYALSQLGEVEGGDYDGIASKGNSSGIG